MFLSGLNVVFKHVTPSELIVGGFYLNYCLNYLIRLSHWHYFLEILTDKSWSYCDGRPHSLYS